jgi:hypothetical protein
VAVILGAVLQFLNADAARGDRWIYLAVGAGEVGAGVEGARVVGAVYSPGLAGGTGHDRR